MLNKLTDEGALAGVKGAHHPALEDGEPVGEAGRDEGLDHHDHHLGAGYPLLGQSARPARHLLTALLPTDQSSDDVNNPVKDESYRIKNIKRITNQTVSIPLVLSKADVSLRTLSIDGMNPFHKLVREAFHKTFRASRVILTLSVSGISIELEILIYFVS